MELRQPGLCRSSPKSDARVAFFGPGPTCLIWQWFSALNNSLLAFASPDYNFSGPERPTGSSVAASYAMPKTTLARAAAPFMVSRTMTRRSDTRWMGVFPSVGCRDGSGASPDRSSLHDPDRGWPGQLVVRGRAATRGLRARPASGKLSA
jgi:hypothetical protein